VGPTSRRILECLIRHCEARDVGPGGKLEFLFLDAAIAARESLWATSNRRVRCLSSEAVGPAGLVWALQFGRGGATPCVPGAQEPEPAAAAAAALHLHLHARRRPGRRRTPAGHSRTRFVVLGTADEQSTLMTALFGRSPLRLHTTTHNTVCDIQISESTVQLLLYIATVFHFSISIDRSIDELHAVPAAHQFKATTYDLPMPIAHCHACTNSALLRCPSHQCKFTRLVV
jgi:hypothetical protein